jgi:MerR family transcriptional regulator, copper efflux regulator
MRPVRHLPIADSSRAEHVEGAHAGLLNGASSAASEPSFTGTGLSPDVLWDEASHGPIMEVDGERLFQVGDLAKATGKTVRAIHHYEDVGLLKPHARSKGRYRLYDHAALTRIRWISKLHDLGMSLAQIQQMLKAWETAPSAPGAMAKIRGHYLQKLEETRSQIARLSALERELVASIRYLDTCDTCDPAELVRACTKCNVHDKTQAEPELVAGIHGGANQGRPSASR